MRLHQRGLLAMAVSVALGAAACGATHEDTPPAVSSDWGSAGGVHHSVPGAHTHPTTREVESGPVPEVALEAIPDAVEGFNLRIRVTGFDIVPEKVSGAHVDGEGHMHLYINGEKVTRLYGEWHHIGSLAPGEHEIRVELSSHDHATLTAAGEVIDATAVVDVAEGVHVHSHPAAREAPPPYPSLRVKLTADPAGGWNLHAVPSGFEIVPERASGAHVHGEGHMHLYINGEKVARLYETWTRLPPLPAGPHEVTVGLSANDHAPLTVNGVAVTASVTVVVPAEDASTATAGDHGSDPAEGGPFDALLSEADQTIAVQVVDGAVVGGPQRHKTAIGSVVALMVTADITDEVHIHGYNILRPVAPGQPAHFAFVAEIPGVYEIELESSGGLLLQLTVS